MKTLEQLMEEANEIYIQLKKKRFPQWDEIYWKGGIESDQVKTIAKVLFNHFKSENDKLISRIEKLETIIDVLQNNYDTLYEEVMY